MSTVSRRHFLASTATIVTAVGVGGRSSGSEQSPSHGDLPPELALDIDRKRKAIQSALAQHPTSGMAVALIHQGQVVWMETFGVTGRPSGTPIDAQTIFSIQSTSKHMTATAVLMAVQNGILELDEPITKYLPGFSVRSRFEKAPERKMTLRLLLSHRAGFTHEAPVGNNYYPAFPSFEAHVRSISDTWLRYPVGQRFAYSNLGIDLAGYILQTATRIPFAEWMKKTVFDPLGMRDSTCDTAVYMARENRAIGHVVGYDVVPAETPLIPSGGVYTSARDLAAYARFHLNEGVVAGRRILDQRLWNQMHAFPAGKADYGLGVAQQRMKFGSTVLDMFHHAGGGFGFNSSFSYYPQAGLAWIALVNRTDVPSIGDTISSDVLSRMFGPPAAITPAKSVATIQLPEDELEKFVGIYVGRGGLREVKFNFGVLGLQAGTTFQRLHFSSPVDAFIGEQEAEVTQFSYEAASNGVAARWKAPTVPDGDLDYNDGPLDIPGPNKKRWRKYAGNYEVLMWGRRVDWVPVHIKNGYLYYGVLRLMEAEDGLFFTADGEAVDFRRDVPTYVNIPLTRLE